MRGRKEVEEVIAVITPVQGLPRVIISESHAHLRGDSEAREENFLFPREIALAYSRFFACDESNGETFWAKLGALSVFVIREEISLFCNQLKFGKKQFRPAINV